MAYPIDVVFVSWPPRASSDCCVLAIFGSVKRCRFVAVRKRAAAIELASAQSQRLGIKVGMVLTI